VLAVKENLLHDHPDTVEKLVKVSQKATDWINQQPAEAAVVVSRQLSAAGGSIFPTDVAEVATSLEITPEVLRRSMDRLEYTTEIDPIVVQATIDYIAGLGYIRDSFSAEEILDLRFAE
jgi:NitT/TauT family transport system substrate-binding protein